MFPKNSKETKFRDNKGPGARAYQKFFTNNKCSSRLWILPAIASFAFGCYLVYINLPRKFSFEPLTIVGIAFIAAALLLLTLLATQQNKNFKGMLVDVEADLLPDVHYLVESIADGERLCSISVNYPDVKCPAAWTESWKIKQLAESENVLFQPGIVFAMRKDKTFFFIHKKEKDKGAEHEG